MIAVTSSQPLEGKTTTACNLGMVLALGGSRVLLVDADMRRPGLHTVIGAQNEIGLSHLLVGQARVRDAVQKTSEPNLFVITAGRIPPNPSELLSSERMSAPAREPANRALRLGHHRHAAGAGRHRRRDRRAGGLRRRVRDRLRDDAARARRARDRDAVGPASPRRSARSSIASTSTATSTTTRATTATTTRTTTEPAARNLPDVGGQRERLPLAVALVALLVWPLAAFGGRSAATAVSFGVACLVLAAFVRPRFGRGLDRSLLALLMVVALPLIPLPASIVALVSPHAAAARRALSIDSVSATAWLPLTLSASDTGWAWIVMAGAARVLLDRAHAVPPRRRAHRGRGWSRRSASVYRSWRSRRRQRPAGTSTGGSGPNSKVRCPSVRSSTAITSPPGSSWRCRCASATSPLGRPPGQKIRDSLAREAGSRMRSIHARPG